MAGKKCLINPSAWKILVTIEPSEDEKEFQKLIKSILEMPPQEKQLMTYYEKRCCRQDKLRVMQGTGRVIKRARCNPTLIKKTLPEYVKKMRNDSSKDSDSIISDQERPIKRKKISLAPSNCGDSLKEKEVNVEESTFPESSSNSVVPDSDPDLEGNELDCFDIDAVVYAFLDRADYFPPYGKIKSTKEEEAGDSDSDFSDSLSYHSFSYLSRLDEISSSDECDSDDSWETYASDEEDNEESVSVEKEKPGKPETVEPKPRRLDPVLILASVMDDKKMNVHMKKIVDGLNRARSLWDN